MILWETETCIKHPNSSTLNGIRLEVSPGDLIYLTAHFHKLLLFHQCPGYTYLLSEYFGGFFRVSMAEFINYWSVLINIVQCLPAHWQRACVSHLDQTGLLRSQCAWNECLPVESVARGFTAEGVTEATFPTSALLTAFHHGHLLEVFQPLQKVGWLPCQSLDSRPEQHLVH